MAEATSMADRRTLRTFRGHLVLTGAIATLSFAAVIALSILIPIGTQLGRADLGSAEAYGLAAHFLFVHAALWPLVALALGASIAAGHFHFQRMRQPLIRFTRAFEAIASGSVPAPITIRSTDYLTDETDVLNAMLSALQRRERARGEAIARLEELTSELGSQGVSERTIGELREIVEQLAADKSGALVDAATN